MRYLLLVFECLLVCDILCYCGVCDVFKCVMLMFDDVCVYF